ncbi:MAG TPA: hypothetical protein VFP66_02165 [Candidatus Limnocylindrales bacterium]|nr:hypothetical protein [Candidatus Limnocylindrales bacterium]
MTPAPAGDDRGLLRRSVVADDLERRLVAPTASSPFVNKHEEAVAEEEPQVGPVEIYGQAEQRAEHAVRRRRLSVGV